MDISNINGTVLVVDDNQMNRMMHRAILARQFDVMTAVSGHEAIDLCRQKLPDLVLLDIEMPGIDGIETCRRLREWTNVPIIFATAHQSPQEHLRAYDAGGNDIATKPVQSDILLRKTALAIRQHRSEKQLSEDRDSLQRMAMHFLSTAGQNGTLLNFMRLGMACRSHDELAQKLQHTAAELGVSCSIMLHHEGGPAFVSSQGHAPAIERAILEQSSSMGRMFQFRRRLVVNYDRVSIIVANMPEEQDSPEAGRIRDNITILAEATEALCHNVDMRHESEVRAEQMQIALGSSVNAVESLREKYMQMLADTRMLLEQMVRTAARNYAWIGATEGQESKMNSDMDASIQSILALVAEGGGYDQHFNQVLSTLRGGTSTTSVELF
jgi:CheY-like chemotaxis protein